jgi:hypothetical protein
MIRVERSIVLDRPVEEVGRFLGDIERQTEWTDMTEAKRLTEGPTRVGTQAIGAVSMGPFKLRWTYEVTAYDPLRGVTFRTVSKSALSMDGDYRVSAEGSGATRIDAVVDIRSRGLLRLLEPLFAGEIRRNESAELDRLKVLLEGEPGVPVAGQATA